MKKLALYIFSLTFITPSIAQGFEYENQAYEAYKSERASHHAQSKSVGDISGLCDAFTKNIDPTTSVFICDGTTYEGLIEFEAVDGELYNVYSTNSNGNRFNDLSFGGYYACYDTDSQEGMSNASAKSPTLFFKVNVNGIISYSGASQWGEIFTVFDVTMNAAELNFTWNSDYGERAEVQLNRHDGQLWEDLLTPCSSVPEADSLALVALYDAADGPNWNIPWDLSTPIRYWYGIELDPASCRVTAIEMGSSEELRNLGFSSNNLTGTIPDEIGNLTELIILDLDRNQLSGEALPKLIGLINLEVLRLNNNSFTGTIIPEISNLINLKFFSILSNNFEGQLPAEIGSLSALEFFYASNNNLNGEIPPEFGQIPGLQQLALRANNFIGQIPNELGNISTLHSLSISFNNLTGEIPESLGAIPFLIHLSLSFNELTGSIPDGFENLNFLWLNDNNLSGEVPALLASQSGIKKINLSNNNFSGDFPSHLITNDSIQSLYFANNNFSGCINGIENLCLKPFNPNLDTITIDTTLYLMSQRLGFDISRNPKMAWEGDLQNACEGESQIGAPCDDGDPNTLNDGIDEDCNCSEESLSTDEFEALNSISVSPNPLFSGDMIHVYLDLNRSINATLLILDVNGKVLVSKSVDKIYGFITIPLETKGLSKGLYYLQMIAKNGVVSRKFVIQ